jgi:hypothetical protein
LAEFENKKLIWWGKDGKNQPRLKRFLKENKDGVVPTTLWLSKDVGHNQEAKAENAKLLELSAQLFATPKPERLLRRVIQIANQVILFSIRLAVPARRARSHIKWGGAGSWWRWASKALLTSYHGSDA